LIVEALLRQIDLTVLLEGVVAVMGLDHGHQRLVFIFEDGHLRQWWAHAEKRRPHELADLDAAAAVVAAAERARVDKSEIDKLTGDGG
jgi:hypothetical protein